MNANKKFSIKTMNLILQNYNLSYVVIRGLFPLPNCERYVCTFGSICNWKRTNLDGLFERYITTYIKP
ncbi:hypothetical protein MtrunA17_Chr5g0394881 [Medicago truncatula]|uniref:Uncharacterized protein n=1 Tax=Medicago truncatula TaxID=3880 RepID=A0A396HNA5_MEDTR|nr:hypothetical protein MtrunA17_Chr5g0394881 [Medicago truncatula]